MDLPAWDRRQCRLVTGPLTDNCTLRRHVDVLGLSENTTCRKCGQEESFRSALAQHTMKIFCSAWVEPTGISRASTRQVQALGTDSFEGF
jgi:hypothetical protein